MHDPNWTATNEAWRFVPSGASLTTIAWHEGTLAGPVVGTTPTINVCPSVTTDYFAEITYNLSCGGPVVKVNDKTTVTVAANKVWDGSSSTDWNTAANWTPASIPTATESVVIPNVTRDPIVGSGVAALACSLTVQNGAVLTVNASNSITVTNVVTVVAGGTFTIKNDGSLVQINNVANIGNIKYERTATAIRGSDYVYWSSPVIGQDMSTIYAAPVQGPKYIWDTTAVNANTGLGNWITTSGLMTRAKGYIIRGSSNSGMAATNINAIFTGVPNNGDITIKAPRGNMQPANVGAGLAYNTTLHPMLNAWDDNWSLVGNPYPSAINALQFLNANSTNLSGNVRLWRHLNTPAAIPSPFYQSFVYNYNSSDYLTINFTGPTTPTASDIIKTGQGFMVQRKEGAADATGTDVFFNNVMRRDGTTILSNSSFFKNSNAATAEKNRIWLDIVDDTNLTSETTLIGYVDGATTSWDSQFDATIGITGDIGIYTFTDNEKCIIQGRPTPFDVNDTVPLGINIHTNGNYHIAVNTVDGLFLGNSQTIYLEDKLLNVIHNLTQSPYSFTSNAGTVNDRFVLRYTNQVLSATDNDLLGNNVTVFASNNEIQINSTTDSIRDYTVYNVLGQTLATKNNVNANQSIVNSIIKNNQALIVKIVLENGQTVVKKIIF